MNEKKQLSFEKRGEEGRGKKEKIKQYFYQELYAESAKNYEEFSPEKMEKILDALDVVDPIAELGSKATDGDVADFFRKNHLERSRKPERKKKRIKQIAAGTAAALVVVLCVDFLVKAAFNQSIIEILQEAPDRFRMNFIPQEEPTIAIEEPSYYSSWYELETDLGIRLLKPSYIPEDIKEVDPVQVFNLKELPVCRQKYISEENSFDIQITCVEEDNTEMSLSSTSEYVQQKSIFLDGGIEVFVYRNGSWLEGFFSYNNCIYKISTNYDYDIFEKIILNMS